MPIRDKPIGFNGLKSSPQPAGSSIWEEFLFRGIITVRLLHSELSFHQVSLLSVGIFTAMHFDVEPSCWLLFVFAAAYLLTGLLCCFGSIGAPLGCHFTFNFIRHMINTETCILAPNTHEHLPLLAFVWSTAAGIAALPPLLHLNQSFLYGRIA